MFKHTMSTMLSELNQKCSILGHHTHAHTHTHTHTHTHCAAIVFCIGTLDPCIGTRGSAGCCNHHSTHPRCPPP